MPLIHLRDQLSRDVNRACTNFFREHGLAESNFEQVMRDQAGGGYKRRAHDEKNKRLEALAVEIERESRGEEL